jgi:bifunctional DNA-binding transcriptional regulator/antitoxin component of YhaV-PrlF toxin-antitoxin module
MVSPFSFAGKSIHLGKRERAEWRTKMVTKFRTVLSPENRLSLPQNVRHELGLDDTDDVIVIVEEGTLRILPAPWTLDQIQGAAKTDRIFSEDFDEEIEEAMEEALRDRYR